MERDEGLQNGVTDSVDVSTGHHAQILGALAWFLTAALAVFMIWRVIAVGRDTERFFHRPLTSTVLTVRDRIEGSVDRARRATLLVGEALARGERDNALLRDILADAGVAWVMAVNDARQASAEPGAIWVAATRDGRRYLGRLAAPESLFLSAATLPIESFAAIGMSVLWHDGDSVRVVAALGTAPPTDPGRAWPSDALPAFASVALSQGQWAGTADDVNGRRVIMVTARGASAPFAIVRTMDASRAAEPFRRRLILDLTLALVLGGGCVLGVFAFARSVRFRALEAQLTAARLSVLQQQLRPHFLFNALNVVAGLIHTDPERADRMIVRLAALLRLSVADDAHRLVSLTREVELLSAYVEAERERFDDAVSLRIDLPVDLSNTLIPAWTLQPLAENVLKHEQPPWVVHVRAERRPGDVVAVTVNGLGPIASARSRGTGVGLRNVRSRLFAAFGGRARLIIRNGSNGDVVAEVLVPSGAPRPGRPDRV